MSDTQVPYRVLARKYRPGNFDELVGQDALVRTLKNAIESGRVAHAFMLTGVRGVGKTTTARIIAKALNYTGADGKAGPTSGPTDDCDICRAIAADRHPDVMEMDAASRTGIDDIREILDGVRYAPTSARYKVYIIDEVHMLSKAAFNALLKTLEEPPEHVKVIFATTEIRKVPVTVLSRCQRFDLKRVDAETLAAHYRMICGKEDVEAEDEALALIARAADGSVRDGLSLLDQAISLSGGQAVSAAQVKDMLGLADRGLILDLLEHALTGRCAPALDLMEDLQRRGADPAAVMQDLLDLTHLLTRVRAVGGTDAAAQLMAREESERAAALAGKLSMPALGRAWQVLLKGLGEVQVAPAPHKAAEMVLIRLAYAADLPDPAELLKRLKDAPSSAGATPGSGGGGGASRVSVSGGSGAAAQLQEQVYVQESATPQVQAASLQDVVALLEAGGAMALASQVYLYAHPVKVEPGRIEIRPTEDAPPRLAPDLGQALGRMTGMRWIVSVSSVSGGPTLVEAARAVQEAEYAAVMKEPLIQEIFAAFPDAEICSIQREDSAGT